MGEGLNKLEGGLDSDHKRKTFEKRSNVVLVQTKIKKRSVK